MPAARQAPRSPLMALAVKAVTGCVAAMAPASPTPATGSLEAVHLWYLAVHEDEVDVAGQQQGQRGTAIIGKHHRMAELGDQCSRDLLIHQIVFHKQDAQVALGAGRDSAGGNGRHILCRDKRQFEAEAAALARRRPRRTCRCPYH